MQKLAECGTDAAVRRHRRRGEVCAECRAAESARKVAAKKRRREAEDAERLAGASVVVEQKLRAGSDPVMLSVPSGSDRLESARWRLAKVRASMEVASPRDMAPLAKREEEIVELIHELSAAAAPREVSALDQLAARRAARIAEASG